MFNSILLIVQLLKIIINNVTLETGSLTLSATTNYTFNFFLNEQNYVKQNDKIKLTFPTQFDLTNTSAQVSFVDNSTELTTTLLSTNIIQITFDYGQTSTLNKLFIIVLEPVVNPAVASLEVSVDVNLMLSRSGVSNLNFTTNAKVLAAFEMSNAYISNTSACTTVAQSDCEFLVKFTPQSDVPADSQLEIIFPLVNKTYSEQNRTQSSSKVASFDEELYRIYYVNGSTTCTGITDSSAQCSCSNVQNKSQMILPLSAGLTQNIEYEFSFQALRAPQQNQASGFSFQIKLSDGTPHEQKLNISCCSGLQAITNTNISLFPSEPTNELKMTIRNSIPQEKSTFIEIVFPPQLTFMQNQANELITTITINNVISDGFQFSFNNQTSLQTLNDEQNFPQSIDLKTSDQQAQNIQNSSNISHINQTTLFSIKNVKFASLSCPTGDFEVHVHNLNDQSEGQDIESQKREVFYQNIDFLSPSNQFPDSFNLSSNQVGDQVTLEILITINTNVNQGTSLIITFSPSFSIPDISSDCSTNLTITSETSTCSFTSNIYTITEVIEFKSDTQYTISIPNTQLPYVENHQGIPEIILACDQATIDENPGCTDCQMFTQIADFNTQQIQVNAAAASGSLSKVGSFTNQGAATIVFNITINTSYIVQADGSPLIAILIDNLQSFTAINCEGLNGVTDISSCVAVNDQDQLGGLQLRISIDGVFDSTGDQSIQISGLRAPEYKIIINKAQIAQTNSNGEFISKYITNSLNMINDMNSNFLNASFIIDDNSTFATTSIDIKFRPQQTVSSDVQIVITIPDSFLVDIDSGFTVNFLYGLDLNNMIELDSISMDVISQNDIQIIEITNIIIPLTFDNSINIEIKLNNIRLPQLVKDCSINVILSQNIDSTQYETFEFDFKPDLVSRNALQASLSLDELQVNQSSAVTIKFIPQIMRTTDILLIQIDDQDISKNILENLSIGSLVCISNNIITSSSLSCNLIEQNSQVQLQISSVITTNINNSSKLTDSTYELSFTINGVTSPQQSGDITQTFTISLNSQIDPDQFESELISSASTLTATCTHSVHCQTCENLPTNCTSCDQSSLYSVLDPTEVQSRGLCIQETVVMANPTHAIVDGVLEPCDSTCKTCVDAISQCTSCHEDSLKKQLVIETNDCVEQCPVGFYADGMTCIECRTECGSCTEYNQCDSCATQDLVLVPQVTGESLCLDKESADTQQIENICTSTQYQNSDLIQCIDCINNCESCNSSVECTSCLDGFHFHPIQLKCKSLCDAGYQSDDSSTCVICDSTCSLCNNATYCTKCIDQTPSLRLTPYPTKDSPLEVLCQTEDIYHEVQSEQCLSNEQQVPSLFNCQNCNDTCASCSDVTTCTRCEGNLQLYDTDCIENKPVNISNLYQSNLNNRCEYCSKECNNCKDDLTDRCNQCSEWCNGNVCINDDQNKIEVCSSNCIECSNFNECINCGSNHHIIDGFCIDSCPHPQKLNQISNTCNRCDSDNQLVINEEESQNCVLIPILSWIDLVDFMVLGLVMTLSGAFQIADSEKVSFVMMFIGYASQIELQIQIQTTQRAIVFYNFLNDINENESLIQFRMFYYQLIAQICLQLILGIQNVISISINSYHNDIKLYYWSKENYVTFNFMQFLTIFNQKFPSLFLYQQHENSLKQSHEHSIFSSMMLSSIINIILYSFGLLIQIPLLLIVHEYNFVSFELRIITFITITFILNILSLQESQKQQQEGKNRGYNQIKQMDYSNFKIKASDDQQVDLHKNGDQQGWNVERVTVQPNFPFWRYQEFIDHKDNSHLIQDFVHREINEKVAKDNDTQLTVSVESKTEENAKMLDKNKLSKLVKSNSCKVERIIPKILSATRSYLSENDLNRSYESDKSLDDQIGQILSDDQTSELFSFTEVKLPYQKQLDSIDHLQDIIFDPEYNLEELFHRNESILLLKNELKSPNLFKKLVEDLQTQYQSLDIHKSFNEQLNLQNNEFKFKNENQNELMKGLIISEENQYIQEKIRKNESSMFSYFNKIGFNEFLIQEIQRQIEQTKKILEKIKIANFKYDVNILKQEIHRQKNFNYYNKIQSIINFFKTKKVENQFNHLSSLQKEIESTIDLFNTEDDFQKVLNEKIDFSFEQIINNPQTDNFIDLYFTKIENEVLFNSIENINQDPIIEIIKNDKTRELIQNAMNQEELYYSQDQDILMNLNDSKYAVTQGQDSELQFRDIQGVPTQSLLTIVLESLQDRTNQDLRQIVRNPSTNINASISFQINDFKKVTEILDENETQKDIFKVLSSNVSILNIKNILESFKNDPAIKQFKQMLIDQLKNYKMSQNPDSDNKLEFINAENQIQETEKYYKGNKQDPEQKLKTQMSVTKSSNTSLPSLKRRNSYTLKNVKEIEDIENKEVELSVNRNDVNHNNFNEIDNEDKESRASKNSNKFIDDIDPFNRKPSIESNLESKEKKNSNQSNNQNEESYLKKFSFNEINQNNFSNPQIKIPRNSIPKILINSSTPQTPANYNPNTPMNQNIGILHTPHSAQSFDRVSNRDIESTQSLIDQNQINTIATHDEIEDDEDMVQNILQNLNLDQSLIEKKQPASPRNKNRLKQIHNEQSSPRNVDKDRYQQSKVTGVEGDLDINDSRALDKNYDMSKNEQLSILDLKEMSDDKMNELYNSQNNKDNFFSNDDQFDLNNKINKSYQQNQRNKENYIKTTQEDTDQTKQHPFTAIANIKNRQLNSSEKTMLQKDKENNTLNIPLSTSVNKNLTTLQRIKEKQTNNQRNIPTNSNIFNNNDKNLKDMNITNKNIERELELLKNGKEK